MSLWVGTSSASGGSSSTTTSNIYLVDSNGFFWEISVLTTGNLDTTLVSSPPSGAYAPHSFAMQDANANQYTVSILTTGALNIASGSSYIGINYFFLNDSTGVTWTVYMNTSGHLVTL